VIESVWGRMKYYEMFDIVRYLNFVRFDRAIAGRNLNFQGSTCVQSRLGLRAWRVVMADRAARAFEEVL
jgi:hypothetical protein